jgi:hypothetical protein
MLEPTQPGMVKFFMGKIHEKYGEKNHGQDLDLGISYLSFCENRRMKFMV